MKLRFALLTLLLLFSRGCDFYSTSLWFFGENGIADETNPLTRFLGIGWTGLILVNILVVSLILFLYYWYCFKYKPQLSWRDKPDSFQEFVSLLYFNQKGKFKEIFYRIPKNKSVLMAHSGYILIRVMIVASFLATVHNLSQFYRLGYYDVFRDWVGRPLYMIYLLIGLTFFWVSWRLLQKEYLGYQRQTGD